MSIPKLQSDELERCKEEAKILIQLMEENSNDKSKSKSKMKKMAGHVRMTSNKVVHTDITINSWKFNEWDYFSKKVVLPTFARGLFTHKDEIVVRGYDKFFNLGETPSTSKEALYHETNGPYEVTVKTNGCIVLISGFADGTLVVCSKHSTGLRNDISKNHSMSAQFAIEENLKKIGLTAKDLALALYEANVTALGEFCDDSFEEHLIEYKGDSAGVYIHGLNYNIPQFKTLPFSIVNEFGEKFGFKKTEYLKFNTVEETFEFLEEASKTGTYQNEEIEGFVVRCHKGNGDDLLFKYKFDEPYMLYRDFRETTKKYLASGVDQVKFPARHKIACMDYLKFVAPLFENNDQLKKDYLDNKNIVEMRKRYMNAKGKTGLQLVQEEQSMTLNELKDEVYESRFGGKRHNKYAIVPVATIGCGKTTIALILQKLYPDLVGHIQNDNLSNPVKDKLEKGALELFIDKQIVVLDKNNHQFRERKQIFDNFAKLNKVIPKDKLKFVCLNFVSGSGAPDMDLWEVTKNRIIERGDNHQSIKAEGDGKLAEGIMKGFINRFQPVNAKRQPDSAFDLVIDLEVNANRSSLDNAKMIVKHLREFASDLQLPEPTEGQFQKAFDDALKYKPTTTKIFKTSKSNKKKTTKPQF
ncbi:unnamed protein product [Ambrosiozyma monospora]|uniref:Unnamed protein product n=1 Tax=Ambrosiozyma monospora TaxID=43982 RepID=A0A9W6Z6S1_AMBMO|nr:unnamed protein product [Ambrosiozyma monospora]